MLILIINISGAINSICFLQESIERIDDEMKDKKPAYYMINCSHTTHFGNIFDDLTDEGGYLKRIRSLKPNGSKKTHKELNNSTSLDTGDPEEFGRLLNDLRKKGGSHLNILSGCCGTDTRHLKEIITQLRTKFEAPLD